MSTAAKQPAKNGSDAQRSAPKRKARGSHCQQGKGNQRRSKLTITNPDAAGIDVGSQVHYVAVPEGRAQTSVRSFGAYTAQLDELVQWLKDCGIKTVAMESTGVYWIALFQKLEEAGFEVLLVDARQAKHVPGRKSDVQDCQWLQQLHTYGLLRAAFRPEDAICRLRTLQRHRKNLIEYAAMWIQHMQKAINEMNLHLHHVLRDISGYSGLAILDAILVMCLLNNSDIFIFAKGRFPSSLDLGQNLLSFSPPHVTLGIEVMLGQVLHDSVHQLAHAAEAAGQDRLLAQVSEEAFDQIHPG